MRDTQSLLRRFSLGATVIGTIGIAIAYATAFGSPAVASFGRVLMAVSMPVTLVAMMTLGAIRRGRSFVVLAITFAFVLLVVTASFVFGLLLPVEQPDAALWLGLPRRAAIVLYGVGIVPLLLLPFVYAWTFDSFTLTDDDVARVRAARLPEHDRTKQGSRS